MKAVDVKEKGKTKTGPPANKPSVKKPMTKLQRRRPPQSLYQMTESTRPPCFEVKILTYGVWTRIENVLPE